jgi:hypothetical protein
VLGGDWSAYWYNGRIYASEIARGLDIFELTPTDHLTQNEIDAAKTVQVGEMNVQNQQKIEWPPQSHGGESLHRSTGTFTSFICGSHFGAADSYSKERYREPEKDGTGIGEGCGNCEERGRCKPNARARGHSEAPGLVRWLSLTILIHTVALARWLGSSN